VLRIFEPKKEGSGAQTKLHNEELRTFYSSRNKRTSKLIRKRWAGHVTALMDEMIFWP
jgi:hypothetical protein